MHVLRRTSATLGPPRADDEGQALDRTPREPGIAVQDETLEGGRDPVAFLEATKRRMDIDRAMAPTLADMSPELRNQFEAYYARSDELVAGLKNLDAEVGESATTDLRPHPEAETMGPLVR